MGTPSRVRMPSRTGAPSSKTASIAPTPPQARTPSTNGYFLFFSHKVNDEAVTLLLIDLLQSCTENIGFFISEKITTGDDWRQAIADNLSRANHLVLVFTDPHENWGWCLYKSGFFDALKEVSKPDSRICCLHHAATPRPSPLSHLQSIPAKRRNVEDWLLKIFEESGQRTERYLKIPLTTSASCSLTRDLYTLNDRLGFQQIPRSCHLIIFPTMRL